MANKIYAKDRVGKNAFSFGALQGNGFQKTAVAINQTNATVQDFFIVPFACKIPFVGIAGDAAIAGLTAFNIVIGSAAEAGALVTDNSDQQYPPSTNTTAGLSLFQNAGNTAPTDQAVALVAFVGQTFQTSQPDAIFPKGTVLTLRIVSGAGGAGNIKVVMSLVPVDIKETNPQTTAFNWLNDVG